MAHDVDPVLEVLLSAVEESHGSEPDLAFHVPITINCNGLLVSGDLISQAEYAQGIQRKISEWMKEIPAANRPIEAVGTAIAAFVGTAPEPRGQNAISASFLHLHARVYRSGDISHEATEPVLWRCPLSAVQGVSLDFGR